MCMPPTICIYTLLTILPVYHHRPRCTGEGVREARAWVWQLGSAPRRSKSKPRRRHLFFDFLC